MMEFLFVFIGYLLSIGTLIYVILKQQEKYVDEYVRLDKEAQKWKAIAKACGYREQEE